MSCFDSKLLNALMWFAARSCRTPDFLRSLNHSRDSVAKCTYLTPSAPTELVQQGGITLRGDEPVAVAGRSYLLGKAEYRFPIIHIVRGDSTLPIFVNRVTGTAFFDYGSAFDVFRDSRWKSGITKDLLRRCRAVLTVGRPTRPRVLIVCMCETLTS